MREHWDRIYTDRSREEHPWHEPVPATLPFVLSHSRPTDAVIDVGGGSSSLAHELVGRGYDDVTVLDLSRSSIEQARASFASTQHRVSWVHGDVLLFEPDRQWDVWHDRAAFHFLVDDEDRRHYCERAAAALRPQGSMIVAAFAPDGPDRCAGLPVRRYGVVELARQFDEQFEFVEGARLLPSSPEGDQRPYVAVVVRRRT